MFPEMEDMVRNFLVLLVREDRLKDLLPDILTTFRALPNEHRGIQIVETTTSEPLRTVRAGPGCRASSSASRVIKW